MMIKKKNPNTHTISVFVANKPGVLVRCAQVFARRGFNIDSLVVSAGVDPRYSRMTITATGAPEVLEQIIKQSSKLVDVMHCIEHTGEDSIDREYAMLKIKCPNPATRNAIRKLVKNRAHILNDASGAIIIGQAGRTEDLDGLEEAIKKKFTILEMVRSGKLAMAVGKEAT